MNTLRICVRFSLLPVAAFGGILDALSASGQPLYEALASPSIVHTQPRNIPVEIVALEAFSGAPVSGSTRNDHDVAEYLSTYLLLHKTWDESLLPTNTDGLNACTE